MLADNLCLDCRDYHFSLEEAVNSELMEGGHEHYTDRGKYYFDVYCPKCGRKQGLVIQRTRPTLFTIWPCSWNDEPCTKDGCEYCEGEYI